MHQKPMQNSTNLMKSHSQGILPLIEPPENLSGRIIARIRLETRKAAWRLSCLLGGAAVLAFSGLVWLGTMLASEISASGSMQYLSLIFSDTGLALSNWREIAFSLIESAPAQAAGLFVLFLFVLLFVARSLAGSVTRYSHTFKTA